MMILGERVKRHRLTKRMTQQVLADALRLSVGYVSLIERGERNPPYTTVVAIAESLGVTARELMGG